MEKQAPPLDPWHLATRLGLQVRYDPLPVGQHGETDGRHIVVLDPRLTTTEETCALYHEIVHILYGHVGHQPPHIEHHVRATVARDLVPIHHLLDIYDRRQKPAHLAARLGVTVSVLHDRLHATTPHEYRLFTEHLQRQAA